MAKKEYSGIDTIVLHNSEVEVVSSRKCLKFWENYQPNVNLDEVVSRDGKEAQVLPGENRTLAIHNARTNVYVPHGRSTNLHAYDHSKATGKFVAGDIDSDRSSEVKLNVPWRFAKNRDSTAGAILEDMLYIGLTAVPIVTVGAALSSVFGCNPQDYWDIYAVAAAGTNIGFRGASKRLLLTTMAVAGAAIFAPEVKEWAVNGLDAGINSLGWEDLLKTGLYFGSFGIGDSFKKFYHSKTQ